MSVFKIISSYPSFFFLKMLQSVANARYQPSYSSGFNQMYGGQGQTQTGHAIGSSLSVLLKGNTLKTFRFGAHAFI